MTRRVEQVSTKETKGTVVVDRKWTSVTVVELVGLLLTRFYIDLIIDIKQFRTTYLITYFVLIRVLLGCINVGIKTTSFYICMS